MARSKDPRMNRREKLMGEQENKVQVAAQPLPGAPQNQKGGNVENSPEVPRSFNQQLGALPESGMNKYPYGDGGIALTDGRMGAVGPIANSPNPQNNVVGQLYNKKGFNQTEFGAPPDPAARQMESMFAAQSAAGRAGKLYAGQEDITPSYRVIPGLGMTGAPAELNAQQPNRGQMPVQMTQQTGRTLPLQGTPDVQMAQKGMNTGRGGGRNQKTQQA